MSFSHAQATITAHNNNANSTSQAVVLTNNPAAGDLVIVGFTWANGAGSTPTTPTLVDSASNSYTLTTNSPSTAQGATAGFDYIFYLLSAPANATKTLTATYQDTGAGAVHAAILTADDFTVSGGTVTFNNDAAGSGTTGTTINTPSITANAAGDLEYAHASSANAISSVDSPWTQGAIDTDGQASGYILSASGSSTAIAMTQTSGAWSSMAASFAFTSSGTPPLIDPAILI
jgi:hypothetical protein